MPTPEVLPDSFAVRITPRLQTIVNENLMYFKTQ